MFDTEAAMTSVKYESDSIDVMGTFVKEKYTSWIT